MFAVNFPQSNRILLPFNTEDRSDRMYVYVDDSNVISCWQLSMWQRIKLLFTGKIWLNYLTNKGTQPPTSITIDSPFDL